jgi:hypothetical protein
MSSNDCPGLPESIYTQSPICPAGKYPCLNKSTTPGTVECKGPRYLISQHYIQNGWVKKGVSGAYLPAVTMCDLRITPVLLSKTKVLWKNYFVEIPPGQVPSVE